MVAIPIAISCSWTVGREVLRSPADGFNAFLAVGKLTDGISEWVLDG